MAFTTNNLALTVGLLYSIFLLLTNLPFVHKAGLSKAVAQNSDKFQTTIQRWKIIYNLVCPFVTILYSVVHIAQCVPYTKSIIS